MDNLDSLFKKKQYELVISLTRESTDPKELFLRLSSLVCLAKSDEALNLIDKYQNIIEEKYPFQLMKLHFELLLSKRLFDEAKIALNHYENLPYISQEVEEFMRDMKERIIDEEHPSNSSSIYSIDEVIEIIEKSRDNSEISKVIFNLKNYNINLLIDSLKKFMKRDDVHPNFRTYILILLIDNKINEEFEFLSINGIIKINPVKLEPPFMSNSFNEVCEKITNKGDKNVSLIETALHLYNCFIIDTYPIDVLKANSEELSDCFIYIAKTYLNIEISLINEKISLLAKKIKQIIESTPEIRI